MPPPVIIDATPLTGGHAGRGIGTAMRGLLGGLAQLPPDERPAALAAPDAAVPDGLDRVDVTFPAWPLVRLGVPDPLPTWHGRRALRDASPRLYHATNPALAGPRDLPTVESCWDVIPLRYPELFFGGPRRVWERRAYRGYIARLARARRVIVNTQAVADDLVRLTDVPGDRIRVVPLAVEHPAGTPAPAASDPPYVLYSGSVEPHKNVELTVDALAASAHPALRLVLTGLWSRRRTDALRAHIARRGMTDRVDLHGHVNRTHLDALRDGATAVLVPSRAEGFGLPPLEAMAAGVPVLASTAAALVEVTAGACPALDPDDPAAWAAAIDVLVAAPDARARAADAGRRHAAGFTWLRTARAVRDVYREVRDEG